MQCNVAWGYLFILTAISKDYLLECFSVFLVGVAGFVTTLLGEDAGTGRSTLLGVLTGRS